MENQQRAPKQAVSQQKIQQQKARQQRMRRKRNNTVKILLLIILAVQLICMIELMILIRVIAANKAIDTVTGQNIGNVQEETLTNDTVVDKIESQNAQRDGTEDWKLVLVNKWNEMEEDYVPELTELAEGHKVDSRIADALMDMIHDAGEAGHSIYIISAYRDIDKQTYLYETEVDEWRAQGYSKRGAEEKAATVVALPRTSEHHLGLAVDLVSSEHVELDEGAELTKGYKWLVKHCHEYGFILRYPNGATDITGIIYEPWHFRYVGEEAAAEIMESGITLEEYLDRVE